MAIRPEDLQRHLDDYAKVMKTTADRFVCPITLRPCEPSELINGHILNEGFVKASRRTVIQYRDVDNFYGTRVEPSLVKYLNRRRTNEADILRELSELKVRFSDGSQAPVFFGGAKAAKKFPLLDLRQDDGLQTSMYAKTAKDDPRLSGGSVSISGIEAYMPSHWVAAMLKSAYLALFDMLGYQKVFNAFGDDMRSCLALYYTDGASRADAPNYFHRFRNAVKIAVRAGAPTQCAFGGDTLDDRLVLLHYTPSDTLFAASCIFRINDVSVTVTVPQRMDDGDVALVVDYFNRLMEDESPVRQVVRWARFQDKKWQVVETPVNISHAAVSEIKTDELKAP